MSLIKVYHLFFYKVRSFLKWTNEDGWEDWKALVGVTLINGLIVTELYLWASIIFKERNFDIPFPKISIAVFSLLITLLNYYATLHHDKWKEYAKEFENYSKQKKIITSWSVFILVLMVFGGIILAFYQMSLIDWKQYRAK